MSAKGSNRKQTFTVVVIAILDHDDSHGLESFTVKARDCATCEIAQDFATVAIRERLEELGAKVASVHPIAVFAGDLTPVDAESYEVSNDDDDASILGLDG